MMDRLEKMFILREEFMRSIAKVRPNVLQDWPVDIREKASQQVVRDTILKSVEELFEATSHLKNWKPHRATETTEFNREEFLEECVDAFNYFLSSLVMLGVTPEEFFESYVEKDKIIHDRLGKNY